VFTIQFLIEHQWSLFIGLEVASFIFLLIFLVIRYVFIRQRISGLFLGLFILCIVLEAILAWFVYQETGKIDTFQIVIAIFIVYAFTFGIGDFKKLDRFIKKHVGRWRGIDLLSEEDIRKMEVAKDPKVIARKNRRWWYTHAFIFVIVHTVFWVIYGNHAHDLIYYLEDLSWFGEEDFTNAPFRKESITQISRIWMIVFAIDTIVSWSYTIFPDKKKT